MAIAVRAKKLKTLTNSGLNFVVDLPAGAVVGDQLYLGVSVHASNEAGSDYTVSAPSTWSLVREETCLLAGQGRRRLYVFRKRYDTGDTSWTFSGTGVACMRVWAILALSGVDPTTPSPSSASQKSDTNTTSHTAPSLTTGDDNAWYLGFWTNRTHPASGNTPPGGMTEVASGQKAGDGGNFGACGFGCMFELRATAGATGTRTLTSAISLTYCAIAVEVKDVIVDQSAAGAGGLGIVARFGIPQTDARPAPGTAEEAIHQEGAQLVPLAIVAPFDTSLGATTEEPFAAGRYITDEGEGKASTRFASRIASAFNVKRTVFQGRRIGGRGLPTAGTLEILNADRKYNRFWSLDWTDREIELLVAGRDRYGDRILFDGARRIFRGRTTGLSADDRSLRIHLSDLAKRFDKPVQELTFAGTGGLEGGTELKGKRKPIVAGRPPNFRPVKISQTEDKYVFHADKGGFNCQSVDAVYVGANLLSPDDYAATLTGGVNWLEILTSIQGDVTMDVTGPSQAGTTLAGFTRYFTQHIGPLSYPTDFDVTRLSIFAADLPGLAGLYVDGDMKLSQVLDAIAGPGGYWTMDENGRLVVGLWKDPAFDVEDHVLRASQVDHVERLLVEPPPLRMRLGYRHNYNQVSESQVVEAARSTARGRFAVEPYLVVERGDPQFGAIAPGSPDPEVWETLLQDESDAVEEAQRIWDYTRRRWCVVRVQTGRKGWLWRLGDVVHITHNNFGLEVGRRLRVAEIEYVDNGATATLWGPDTSVLGLETGEVLGLEDGAVLGLE